ncbi:MAG: protocatechuate 3,4-dioxygenase subunit alpha [Bryobacteraceae bacterium]
MSFIPSGSQTVGPFFNFGLTTDARLGRIEGEGERIRVEFHVTDGEGSPTPGDSMVELWQADGAGQYGPHGFARLETDPEGKCMFETIRPGRVGDAAQHINVIVFARGLLKHLHTRLYFEGEPLNATDAVLNSVPAARRSTLVATLVDGVWRMPIRLQGDGETVFFDV